MPHVANRVALTNKIIAATAWDGRAHHVLWDASVPGLGLRIRPSSRTWVVRVGTGVRETIGRYTERERAGALTIPEARKAAAARMNGVELEPVKPAPKRFTLADVWANFQETEFPRLADRSVQDYKDRWKNHLRPALGNVDLADIKGGDVIKLHATLRNTKPTTANRVVALLSNLWNYARACGDTPEGRENPARAIDRKRKAKESPRTRVFAPKELRAFLRTVDALEAAGTIRPCEAAGLLLVPHALLRPKEITRLRWTWVDLDARTITIPPEHAKGARISRSDKPEIAVLSKAMADRLRKLDRVSDEHVVPSVRGGPVFDLSVPWLAVRAAAKLPDDLILYDGKRTALTMLRDAGVPDSWRHAAARHREQGVQERHYAQANVDQARKAIDKLAELLAKAAKGR